MKVDTTLIEWLLSNRSQFYISKQTGLAQSTLSRLKNGHVAMEDMTVKTASVLTECAEKEMRLKEHTDD